MQLFRSGGPSKAERPILKHFPGPNLSLPELREKIWPPRPQNASHARVANRLRSLGTPPKMDGCDRCLERAEPAFAFADAAQQPPTTKRGRIATGPFASGSPKAKRSLRCHRDQGAGIWRLPASTANHRGPAPHCGCGGHIPALGGFRAAIVVKDDAVECVLRHSERR